MKKTPGALWITLYLVFLIGTMISIILFLCFHKPPIHVNEDMKFVIEEYKEEITPFSSPLPDKYIDSITSSQDIRKALTAEEAGMSTTGLWHNGLDIACPEKTPIYAAKSGIVYTVFPSFFNGKKFLGHKVYGGLIIIKHCDHTITLYGHLSRTDVIEGEWVEQGQTIGLSGGVKNKRGSGISTGPHLHFLITFDIKYFIFF